MAGAVLPPCCLAEATLLRGNEGNGSRFRRLFSHGALRAPACSRPLSPAARQRLLDPHGQAGLRLLRGRCSFLRGPSVHKALCVPSKSLLPQSCGSSVIRSHWPPKSNSLGVLSPFARFPGWEICCGSYNFLNSERVSLV